MRKILIISIIGILFSSCQKVADINPASDGLFIKYYGNDVDDGQSTDAGSMVVNESEVVVVGTVSDSAGGGYPLDIYLLKTDLIGKIISEKMINTDTAIVDEVIVNLNDYGRDIKLAPDGGYYVLGERNTLAGDKDLVLLKVNSDLKEEWVEILNPLGVGKNETARALCVQDDGGLAILGEYNDNEGTLRSFLYVYYRDTPGQSWVSDHGNQGKDFNAGKSLLQRETQGYSFPASANNYGDSDDSRAILFLTDDAGGAEDPVPFGIKNIGVDLLKFGAEFVMLSNNYDTGNVPDSISVFRIDDEDLTRFKEERIGPGNLEGSSIATTQDGYVITGVVHNGSQTDICLIKTDHNIKPLWDTTYKSFGGNGNDYGVKVAAVENGYLILGISQVAGLRMITLIRTDLEGNLITN